MTTQWIIDVMEEWAPTRWAYESDNVGLLVGDRNRPVSRVLTALDLSEDVLKEAVSQKFDMCITHHPLISRHSLPINRITTDNTLGRKLMTLMSHGIGLYCAHTNLDAAPGGVNDLLFDLFDKKVKSGFESKGYLTEPESPDHPTIGLIGRLAEAVSLSDLAESVSKSLSLNGLVRYVGAPNKQINTIGLCSGNGTSCIQAALAKKCDVFITGDISYHIAMDTLEAGMAMIDASHYSSEIPIAEAITARITAAAKKSGYNSLIVETSQVDGQVFKTV